VATIDVTRVVDKPILVTSEQTATLPHATTKITAQLTSARIASSTAKTGFSIT
jgi:hypothetical protein